MKKGEYKRASLWEVDGGGPSGGSVLAVNKTPPTCGSRRSFGREREVRVPSSTFTIFSTESNIILVSDELVTALTSLLSC